MRYGVIYYSELGLNLEPLQGQDQMDNTELCGPHAPSVDISHSEPVLSNIMGPLYRIRRSLHTESAPGLVSVPPRVESSP